MAKGITPKNANKYNWGFVCLGVYSRFCSQFPPFWSTYPGTQLKHMVAVVEHSTQGGLHSRHCLLEGDWVWPGSQFDVQFPDTVIKGYKGLQPFKAIKMYDQTKDWWTELSNSKTSFDSAAVYLKDVAVMGDVPVAAQLINPMILLPKLSKCGGIEMTVDPVPATMSYP